MDYIDLFTDSLAYRLHEAHRRVQDHYIRHLKKLKLTPAQVYALCILKDKKLAVPSEIADILKISRPSVTNLLLRMERDELISRVADKMNKRRKWVMATDKGISKMEEAQRGLKRAETAFYNEENVNIHALKDTLEDLTESIDSIQERAKKLKIGTPAKPQNTDPE